MEEQLPGGNAGGAVLTDGTVRRPTGPWTPAVHALLRHLEVAGFTSSPKVYGLDDRGREVLSYLTGRTIGTARPWPTWVHSDEALVQIGQWLRNYHAAVSDFVPPPGVHWRTSRTPWRPGDVIGHNDAAPYNAVWVEAGDPTGPDASVCDGDAEPVSRLVGLIDWDLAAPCLPVWDLAFVAFSWVPLHARDVVAAEGFTAFADRPRRLRLLLGAYGWTGGIADVLDAVGERVTAHAAGVRDLASAGDPLFQRLVVDGVVDGLERSLHELETDRSSYC